MLTVLRQRIEDDEEGFTLIELMVVVLIIAILIAIAIPTFIGARERAQDRAAQSNLRNAYASAKTIYTDTQQWSTVTPAMVQDAEPTLTVDAAASTESDMVSLAVGASEEWIVLAVESDSGTCFMLAEVLDGSGPGNGTHYQRHDAACTANIGGTWSPSWADAATTPTTAAATP